MNSFVNRCLLALVALVPIVVLVALQPAPLAAQGQVVTVTICDSADITGCEDKARNRAPYRMIFNPEVLTVDCDIENETTCSNESSAVSWDITNKQDDHEADVKYTGRSAANRRIFTERRIPAGRKVSVPERPRNLSFDSNDEARWRYEIIVLDANGQVYARRDPEIVIKGRRN